MFQDLLRLARRSGLIAPRSGTFIGRKRTRDTATAFAFRMPAGFPGDVNRGHPASIEPTLIDASAPPTAYGQGVVVDATTNGVRPLSAGDTALTALWGITVRPYPIQQSSASNFGQASFGAATPPVSGEIDVLRWGYIMAVLPAGAAAVTKGAAVFIWCAASSGAHVQGGFESAGSGGNTAALDTNRYMFNGPADAGGNVEIYCR